MTKILVIDDDRDIRFVVAMNLRAEGYEVVECGDGFSALEVATTQQPDIIVCDIMMPGLDGYAVLEQLRTMPATSRIPLIFLSAKATDREIWTGWSAGADYYLTKPFDPEELLHFIRYIEAHPPVRDLGLAQEEVAAEEAGGELVGEPGTSDS